ncbi:hypothetical protein E4P29_18695 [Rhodococcus sp. 1R11]|uniref:hypothetical protein n=1 Tax=Rhodococcus sp. 1R11 TaxID=2559614 RepID=UPI001071E1F8|nr:hypothetical protein [Rhodococcus sp. 1R11]TFI42079.1 hypothetical protein E4P29_18695 [Rhodococcus sp. 1R11]
MSTANQRRIRKIAREAADRYVINRAIDAWELHQLEKEIWTDDFVQRIADLRAAEQQTNKPWWRFWL